jgi:hypothetical protein
LQARNGGLEQPPVRILLSDLWELTFEDFFDPSQYRFPRDAFLPAAG